MVINIISPHASLYLGGMEIVTLQMARHLAKHGITVRFFTRKTDIPSDAYQQLLNEQSDLLKVIEVPLSAHTPLPNGTWPIFYQIARDFGIAAKVFYSKYSDADLFITHLSVDSLFIPKSAKIILHLHGSPDTTDPLMEAAVQIPISTLCHSYSIKDWWTNNFPHLTPSVFHNGIDTTFFTGEPDAERPIDILYVGRFMEHKGIDDILQTVQAGQKVVIAGNGQYLPALEEIVRKRGLENAITFYNKPTTETIRELYQKAKIFACPSKGKEGLLTTLLEAGASGCAIVTTSGSGMTDLVENGRNGIVVSPGDSSALRASFDGLLKNREKRLALAQAIQKEIRESWSWNAKSLELKELYHAAL